MQYKQLENILLSILLVFAGGIYLYTVAPTLSFWDCGEFISASYTLAVPHPPGTPFFEILGRVWLMIMSIIAAVLPISKEVAWHMNVLGIGFNLLTIFLTYRLILKILRMSQRNSERSTNLIIAFASCLGITFFYTIWENALETEVYGAATFIFILINYFVFLWYEGVKQGKPRHEYIILSFYLIFLSTGIHLLLFLICIPLYIFMFAAERHYLKDWLLLLLGLFQIILFLLLFILPQSLYTTAIILLILILLGGIILPLNNPMKYRNWRFFWIGIFLIIMGISTELYLPIRSSVLTKLYKDKKVEEQYLAGKNIAPRINECEPGESLEAFNNVLHRVQYGPQRVIPRQTQDETGYGVIEGYFWQFAMFIRYLSWQPIPEDVNRFFRALVLALFYLFAIWGMVELYKREKKIFLLMIMIMFMLSFATVSYLNMKFSPSDSNPKHQPREVRERDYFFIISYAYFGIFISLGFVGFLDWLKNETRNNKFAHIGGLTGIVAFSIIPFFANVRINNRYKDFIPKDYGYNMLTSCDDGSVVFTNGDNDTFPLWFAQEVLGIKRRVIVANLSLINTDWYIRQLKYWGAPIRFSEYVIKRLGPYITPDRRVILVKDIMIRHILATNAGIELKDEDYFIPQEEFAKRYLKGYKGKRTIYFSSTVSEENHKGFAPYLRLEGLVYRVTGDSLSPMRNIDVARTKNFFYNIYRYTGVFEPKKQKMVSAMLNDFDRRKNEGEFFDYAVVKDENTKRLYTNYAAGLFALGLELKEQGDIKGTIEAWRFALLFEPQPIFPFLYNLGLLYAQIGDIDSAENYFSQINIRDPQIISQIGNIYRTFGKYDEAIEYFQRAIAINPRAAQGYMGLLTIYIEKGDKNSAVKVLKDWLSLNPRDTTAYNMLKELEGTGK